MNKILPIILAVTISNHAYPNERLEYICESLGSLYWSQLINAQDINNLKAIDEKYETSKDDFNSDDIINLQIIGDRICIKSGTEMEYSSKTNCTEYKMEGLTESNKTKFFTIEKFRYKFDGKIISSMTQVSLEDLGLRQAPVPESTKNKNNLKIPFVAILFRLTNKDLVQTSRTEKKYEAITRVPVLAYRCMLINKEENTDKFTGLGFDKD
jgi:hypothetical protein